MKTNTMPRVAYWLEHLLCSQETWNRFSRLVIIPKIFENKCLQLLCLKFSITGLVQRLSWQVRLLRPWEMNLTECLYLSVVRKVAGGSWTQRHGHSAAILQIIEQHCKLRAQMQI